MFFGHKHHKGRRHSEFAKSWGHGFGHAFGHGFGHGWGHRARGHRGGARRRVFDGSALKLILLRLIEQEARHGYDLIREIEALSGGVYAPSPGVIYPTLTLLAEMGLIEEVAAEGSRKQFSITAAGSAHLAENHDVVEQLIDRLGKLGADENGADHAPIARALENLQSVIRHRLMRSDASVNSIHDAAALIDEAAQKIERL